MKEKFAKLFNPSDKRKRNVMAVSAASLAFSSAVLPAFANASAGSIVNQIVDIVTGLFMMIGVILLVWAIGQLVLAFKNEDADSKSKAIMLLVVSAVLIGIGPILDALGLDTYVTQANGLTGGGSGGGGDAGGEGSDA